MKKGKRNGKMVNEIQIKETETASDRILRLFGEFDLAHTKINTKSQ